MLRSLRPASDHWPVAATWELLDADDRRVSTRHPNGFRRRYDPFTAFSVPSRYGRCNASWYQAFVNVPTVVPRRPQPQPPKKNYAAVPRLEDFQHDLPQMRIAGASMRYLPPTRLPDHRLAFVERSLAATSVAPLDASVGAPPEVCLSLPALVGYRLCVSSASPVAAAALVPVTR